MEKNLDEINVEAKEKLLQVVEKDEKIEGEEREEKLSVAERMKRRAIGNTFTLTFIDEVHDDEIELEFRLLFSGERRDFLKLIQELQGMKDSTDVVLMNEKLDNLIELVKAVTVTEGMNEYYDSEMCQDQDIIDIATAVLAKSISTVEEAQRFRNN